LPYLLLFFVIKVFKYQKTIIYCDKMGKIIVNGELTGGVGSGG